jgi:hypothetical protein
MQRLSVVGAVAIACSVGPLALGAQALDSPSGPSTAHKLVIPATSRFCIECGPDMRPWSASFRCAYRRSSVARAQDPPHT